MTELRVLSYNVHTLRDDRAALTAVVRGLEPDVVILQEAPRRFRWRTKTANLAHDFGLLVAAGGLPALGNLLLTNHRVRVHDEWCLRYPLTAGRHMRGAAFARCSVGSTPFVVAGSHLSTDPEERPAQAALLKKALSEVDLPVILGGDLNEGASGPAWRTLADGLVDAAVTADLADRHTFSCSNPRARIDALFVDPRIEVRRYEVVDTPEAHRASDHFPLLADLVLPSKEAA
jgi:endonuclease/exonuclease/phosphatase family metal-dependent hydrolase